MLKAKSAVRELRLWLPAAAARAQSVEELQQRITKICGGVTRFNATGTDSDGFEEYIVYTHWIAFSDWAAVRASGLLRTLVHTLLTAAHQNSVLVDYGTGNGPTLYYDEPISG